MSGVVEARCIVCNSIKGSGVYPVCRACENNETEKIDKVRDLYDGMLPNINIANLAYQMGVSNHAILWYLRTGIIGDKGAVYQAQIEKMKRNNLTIEEKMFGNYIWLKIGGKIDSMNAEDLKEHIEGLLDFGWENMILDLEEVAFFCSTGIRVVLSTYKHLVGKGGKFYIENPSKSVSNVLGMVALNQLLLK